MKELIVKLGTNLNSLVRSDVQNPGGWFAQGKDWSVTVKGATPEEALQALLDKVCV